MDFLSRAYKLVRTNKGACGVDGVTIERIEGMEGGEHGYLGSLAKQLRNKDSFDRSMDSNRESILE